MLMVPQLTGTVAGVAAAMVAGPPMVRLGALAPGAAAPALAMAVAASVRLVSNRTAMLAICSGSSGFAHGEAGEVGAGALPPVVAASSGRKLAKGRRTFT